MSLRTANLTLLTIAIAACVLLIAGFAPGRTPAAADDPWQFTGHHSTFTLVPRDEEGVATPQMVFPPDERVRVTNTRDWPYRLIAEVSIFDEWDEMIATCSGVMVSANTLLTAAHCLYDYDNQKWYAGNLIIPGEDGSTWPYGTAIDIDAGVPEGYRLTGDTAYDIGVVKLYGSSFRPSGPYPSVASVSDTYFHSPNVSLFTAGYPGDKAFGTQWWTKAAVQYVDSTYIYTTMDAYHGQSGSAIFTLNTATQDAFVVGVYSFETDEYNAAVRLTPTKVNNLRAFCESAGCGFASSLLSDPTPAPSPTPTATPTPIRGATLPQHRSLPAIAKDGGY